MRSGILVLVLLISGCAAIKQAIKDRDSEISLGGYWFLDVSADPVIGFRCPISNGGITCDRRTDE
jgi:hypothetical protein